MNKKAKLLIVSLLSISLCTGGFILLNNHSLDFLTAVMTKPEQLSCDYYFNSGEYTSLYELNYQRLENGADVTNSKTWGTVTCTYLYGSKNCQIIQSTDRNGNVGATVLYNTGSTYSVGSVLTIKNGKATLYDGMSQITGCEIIEDYKSNPYEVIPLEITEALPSRDDTDYNYYRYMGTRKVVLNNVTITNTSTNKARATLPNNDQIEVFYGS